MSSKYTAFISYSHRDSTWARWLQRALETYRIPKTLSNELGVSRKLGKVFRDREELPTGQNLGDHLTQALENSDNLIVICSPQSKASPWVAKEIEYFKSLGKGDRIFCLLVEGGAEALAEPLLYDLEGNALEPLAADPRKDADGKHLAKLKLVSGILETNLDQLAQREKARQQRLLTNWAAFGFVVLTTIAFFVQNARNEAQLRAVEIEAGMQNVATMTAFFQRSYDYYDIEMLSWASDDIGAYIERFPDSELNLDQKLVKAAGLRTLARAEADLGRRNDAERHLRMSRDIYTAATLESGSDIDLAIELAFADFYLGDFFIRGKEYDRAKAPIASYATKIEELATSHPMHPSLIAERIYAQTARLKLELDASANFTPEMKKIIDTSSVISEQTILEHPDKVEVASAYQTLLDYFGDAYLKKQCNFWDALPYRERSVGQARRTAGEDPENRRYLRNLSNSLSALANLRMGLAEPNVALPLYLEALKIQRGLAEKDPANLELARRIVTIELEVYAAQTYHPYDFRKISAALNIVKDLESNSAREKAREVDLEALWLTRMIDRLISTKKWKQAILYSYELHDLINTSGEDIQQHYRLIQALHHEVISLRAAKQTPTDGFSRNRAEKSFLLGDRGNSLLGLDSCPARLASWASSALAGDIESAANKAKRDWALGSRGLEMAFFSKQLGIPFPEN